MTKKIFKNQNGITILLLFSIFLFTSVPYIQKGFNFLKSIFIKAELIDGKKYYCPFISNDEKNKLKILTDLISNFKKIRNESGKLYDEDISNCGTDKEFESSPEMQKIWDKYPDDIKADYDEYHRTKTYTIKDFQECRKFWEDAKKDAYEESTKSIEEQEKWIKELITKNNCRLLTN